MLQNNSINRSFWWKLVNLWFIPVSALPVFTVPFGILYMALVTDKYIWIRYFVIAIALICVSIIGISSPTDSDFWPLLASMSIICVWFGSIIFMCLKAKEFLRLLDTKLRNGKVLPKSEPSLTVVKQSVVPRAGRSVGQRFIDDLRKWHDEVESDSLKNDIRQLIDLSVLVLKKEGDNDDFFLNYDESVNKMLKRYDEMENTRINSSEMQEAMAYIENGITVITKAFSNQVTKLYKNDILDIHAETAAFIQNLKNKGLLDGEV